MSAAEQLKQEILTSMIPKPLPGAGQDTAQLGR